LFSLLLIYGEHNCLYPPKTGKFTTDLSLRSVISRFRPGTLLIAKEKSPAGSTWIDWNISDPRNPLSANMNDLGFCKLMFHFATLL
jgi:hypothetical protein